MLSWHLEVSVLPLPYPYNGLVIIHSRNFLRKVLSDIYIYSGNFNFSIAKMFNI